MKNIQSTTSVRKTSASPPITQPPDICTTSASGNVSSQADKFLDAPAAAKELAQHAFAVTPVHRPIFSGQGLKCSCGNTKCRSIGKHPMTPNGVLDAAREGAIVDHFPSRANVGVATGTKSKIFVVDVDPRNGGQQTLDALFAQHGNFPETVCAKTGGNGAHYYFNLPAGVVIKNGKLGPGIDIKGENGLVVAPPSHHRSGDYYEWKEGHALGEIPRADAPAWLLDLLPKSKMRNNNNNNNKGSRRDKIDIDNIKSIPEGERHTTLMRIVGKLRAQGLNAEALERRLETINEKHCVPPLAEAEVQSIAASMAEKRVALTLATAPSLVALRNKELCDDDWERHLIMKNTKEAGEIVESCAANVITILSKDPRLADVVAYDEFSINIVKKSEPPWHEYDKPRAFVSCEAWSDQDAVRLASWLSREWGIRVSVEQVWQALGVVAQQHTFHPVREYFERLVWDGTPRLRRWLSTYLGAPDSPYARLVGIWWLISVVARVFQPGCKADHLLILEGAQGKQKSTALRKLAGEAWFTDSAFDITNKDAFLVIQGRLIVELAELATLSRAEAAKAKQFFSSSTDRYRPPYGRFVCAVPRQCIFAGTVNEAEYLKDATGNRRYWPVACGDINIPALEADREHLFAEAVALYKAGHKWYPSTAQENALCEQEQVARQPAEPWSELIEAYIKSKTTPLTATEILAGAIGKTAASATTTDAARVGRIMKTLGWERRQSRVDGERVRRYYPPAAPTSSGFVDAPSPALEEREVALEEEGPREMPRTWQNRKAV